MNCRRVPDRYRGDAAADADIARVQQLWRQLRDSHGGGTGDFLCGGFGIVDAMFAPVVFRFRGYGVPLDDNAARYCDALFALPAMREWLSPLRQNPNTSPRPTGSRWHESAHAPPCGLMRPCHGNHPQARQNRLATGTWPLTPGLGRRCSFRLRATHPRGKR